MGYYSNNAIPGAGPYTKYTRLRAERRNHLHHEPDLLGREHDGARSQPTLCSTQVTVKQVIIYYKPDDISRYTDLSKGVAESPRSSPKLEVDSEQPEHLRLGDVPVWANIVSSLAFNTNRYPTNVADVRLAIMSTRSTTR